MNQTSHPLLISLAITLTAVVVGLQSYSSLLSEEDSKHLVLGSLPLSPISYSITAVGDAGACFGSLDIAINSSTNQATLTMKGWMNVSLLGRTEPIKFDALLIFNALGQLSAGVLRTEVNHESVRLGTLGVNPITVQLYRGIAESPPVFQQAIPGPIELRPRGESLQIIAPHIPVLRALGTNTAIPLSIQRTSHNTCSQEAAQALDLTPFARMAETWAHTMRELAPPL